MRGGVTKLCWKDASPPRGLYAKTAKVYSHEKQKEVKKTTKETKRKKREEAEKEATWGRGRRGRRRREKKERKTKKKKKRILMRALETGRRDGHTTWARVE